MLKEIFNRALKVNGAFDYYNYVDTRGQPVALDGGMLHNKRAGFYKDIDSETEHLYCNRTNNHDQSSMYLIHMNLYYNSSSEHSVSVSIFEDGSLSLNSCISSLYYDDDIRENYHIQLFDDEDEFFQNSCVADDKLALTFDEQKRILTFSRLVIEYAKLQNHIHEGSIYGIRT